MPALVALQVSAQNIVTYTTTYSTLGEPGDTYNANAGWLVNGSASPPQPYVGEAFSFTPTVSGYLGQIDLVLSAVNSTPASDFANISLTGNNNVTGLPFGLLERFHNVGATGPFGLNNPLTTLDSSAHPFLQAGNTYWLEVEPATTTSSIVVNVNSLGLTGNQCQEFAFSSWGASGNQSSFAFDVEVTPVPEPGMVSLFVLGGLLFFARGWFGRAAGKA